ncbi:unnamed protein product [Chrysoparadoxa australica]
MSSKRVRMGLKILHGIGLKQSSNNTAFDLAFQRYTFLRAFVDDLRERLETYSQQLVYWGDSTRMLGACLLQMYQPDDVGFKASLAYKEVYEAHRRGYINHLREAFIEGIVKPTQLWQQQIHLLEGQVVHFKAVRLKFDHYRAKVADLEASIKAAADKQKDVSSLQEKLRRNISKLTPVADEYDEAAEVCCTSLNRAWRDKLNTLNSLVGRLLHFEESFYAHSLMQSLGLTHLLEDGLGGRGVRAGFSVEAFLPRFLTKHHEGTLVKRGKVMRIKVNVTLVGNQLSIYEGMESSPGMSVSTNPEPKSVHTVQSVATLGDDPLVLRVALDDDGRELTLQAATEREALEWHSALERAAAWDEQESAFQMDLYERLAVEFREKVKGLHDLPAPEVERRLGVTDALKLPYPKNQNFPMSLEAEEAARAEERERMYTSSPATSSSASISPWASSCTSHASLTSDASEGGSFMRRMFGRRKDDKGSTRSRSPVGRASSPTSQGNGSAKRGSVNNASPAAAVPFLEFVPPPPPEFAPPVPGPLSPRTTASGNTKGDSSDGESSGDEGEGEGEEEPGGAKQIEKAFRKLCMSHLSSDAGLISFNDVVSWDEVQDLMREGWITRVEVRRYWDEACAAARQHQFSEGVGGSGAPGLKGHRRSASNWGMDMQGFKGFIRLMEEKRFEVELEANHGIALEAGPAVEV